MKAGNKIRFDNSLCRIIVILGLVLLTSGCQSVSWVPYVGEQRDWPTAPGSFVRTEGNILIFSSLPNRPYSVLGRVAITSRHGPSFAKPARQHGADAVILGGSQMFSVGTVTTGNTTGMITPIGSSYMVSGNSIHASRSIHRTLTAAWLIRFSTNNPPVDSPPTTADNDRARLQTLNNFLLWLDEHPDGATVDDGHGTITTYTAARIAERRAEVLRERADLAKKLGQ
jgi:hypothetical protein